MGELLLREVIEHIGLVLGKIQRALQKIAAVFRALDAGIVPRRHRVAPVLFCIVPKTGKFHAAVAKNTGVGRFADGIAVCKTVDDFLLKRCGIIQDDMGKPHHFRNGGGVEGILFRATHSGIALAAIKPHGDAEETVARLLQQRSCHGAVHAAAHGDQYLFTHAPLRRALSAVPHSRPPRRFPYTHAARACR